MLSFISDHLAAMERDPSVTDRASAIRALRGLGLNDFGQVLWSMPDSTRPRLSRLLPEMTPLGAQQQWTGGGAPEELLSSGVGFVRTTAETYTRLTGRSLGDARILDLGCGYGRFLRLYEFYTDTVVGVDPLDASLEMCAAAGYGDRVVKSDPLSRDLGLERSFDFAFAFSVFTHLDEAAADIAMDALAGAVRSGGILCVTIRPVEIWRLHARRGKLKFDHGPAWYEKRHHEHGHAFAGRPGVADGLGNFYGTASTSLAWFDRHRSNWTVVAQDRSMHDPMQRYIFLRRTG